MDYEIDLSTLNSKKTNLNKLKKDSEDAFSEFNSNFASLSGTELKSIYNTLTTSVKRLKNGGANSNSWFEEYITTITNLEEELAALDNKNLKEIKEFKGKFEDMFGRVTMPVLKTNGDTHALAQPKENGVYGVVGDTLLKYSYNGKEFYITNTKLGLDEYAEYIRKNRMYQDAGFQGGECMLLSQYYASDLLMGKRTSKSAMDSHSGAPAVKMNERCASPDPQVVLNYAFDELNAGHPVVLQVTQKNSYKGSRHLVTLVGYTSDVKSAADLTPEKMLVLDCYDGKVQTLNERNRKIFKQGKNYQALGPTDKFLSTIS